MRYQRRRQRGWKLYSLHTPEIEGIGKCKARTSYEFGRKVSIATPVTQPKGSQFVLHAKAQHRMQRHYLKGRDGDHANALLAVAGYKFSLLIRWFEVLSRALIEASLKAPFTSQST